jgi:hypothetical protein
MHDTCELPVTRDAIIARNKTALISALKTLGLTSATVTYSGGGDSGQVDTVAVTPTCPAALTSEVTILDESYRKDEATGQFQPTVIEKPMSLEDALEDFASRVSYEHAPGGENNDGGRGELTLNAEDGTYHLEHTNYYTESNTEDYFG